MGTLTLTSSSVSCTVIVCLVLLLKSAAANDNETCGGSKIIRVNPRVVGGAQAELGEFPFVVSLRLESESYPHCTGTILSTDWIITAAHCMFDKRLPLRDEIVVQAGLVDRENPGAFVQSCKILQVVTPKEYHVQNGFDVALLKLKNPLNMTKTEGYIGKICLPEFNHIFQDVVTMVGWGCLNEKSRQKTRYLQKLDMEIRKISYCRKRVPPPKWGDNGSNDGVICASSPQGCGHGLCHGDSGGPILKSKNGIYTIAGVLSYGKPSCQGLFSNLTQYLSWIKNTTNL